jgi:tRNA(Arg) A34 adenosine deaminase TadA
MDADQDSWFLGRAVALSRNNVHSSEGGPFGAVVVHEGRIVGEGWNRVTSSNDPTAHAEVVAIRDACATLDTFCLEGATIYSSCEPCPMCLAAIYWARISRIVYANTRHDAAAIGFDDAHFYEQVALPPEQRQVPCIHRSSPDARAVFAEWAAKADKLSY